MEATISGWEVGRKYRFGVIVLSDEPSDREYAESALARITVTMPKYTAVKSVKAVASAATLTSVTLTWKASIGAEGKALSEEALAKVGIGTVADTEDDKNNVWTVVRMKVQAACHR